MHCRTALSMNDLLGMMDRNGPNGADLGTSVLTDRLGFSEKDEVVFVSCLKPLETEVLGFYCHFFLPHQNPETHSLTHCRKSYFTNMFLRSLLA